MFCRLVLQGMLEAGLVLLGCVMPALPDVEDDVRNTSFASQSPSNSSSSSSSSRGGDSAGGDDDSGMGVFSAVEADAVAAVSSMARVLIAFCADTTNAPLRTSALYTLSKFAFDAQTARWVWLRGDLFWLPPLVPTLSQSKACRRWMVAWCELVAVC